MGYSESAVRIRVRIRVRDRFRFRVRIRVRIRVRFRVRIRVGLGLDSVRGSTISHKMKYLPKVGQRHRNFVKSLWNFTVRWFPL